MDHDHTRNIIKGVNYSFYSALGVILLVIVLYFASLYSQKWIVHTNAVKAQIYNVNESIIKAESLQRGYILSKDQNYRIDYKVTIKELYVKLEKLRKITLDNPTMQDYIKKLQVLVNERVTIMDRNIKSYVVGTADQNRGYAGRENVLNLIASIDDIRDAMLIEENRLLKERTSTYDTIYGISLFVLALGIGLMLYSLYMLRIRLLPLFTKLEQQNDDLEATAIATQKEIMLKEEQMHLNADLIVQLEEKNSQLNQFAYIASHDLQEPLRTVDNFIDLFQEDYGDKLDSEALQYFDFIKGATSRMKALITGLLNYSRLGRSEIKSKIDLNKVLEEIKADFTITINEKDASITSDPLPTINGYPVELKQLFANLISNALKFIPPERTPKIHISTEEKEHQYIFKVRDNGLGIKDEHLSRIFSMFTRLHSARDYKGTGIGLAFCQKIVDLHKGKITVVSEVGKGSTFRFTIKKLKL